jgi:hypothetical protein
MARRPARQFSFFPYNEIDRPGWTRTGLIDGEGRPIWRSPRPLGFGKREGLIEP